MGPIAAKVLKEIRKPKHAKVIDLRAVRELRELTSVQADVESQDGLPPAHAEWMRAFHVLFDLASNLLNTSALRKLAEQVAAAQEEYMPGGPPMSPIFDSVFSTWWLSDLPIGPRRETVCSIIVDLTPILGFPPAITCAARALASGRFGIYRVRETGPDRVELTDLFTAQRLQAHVPKDMSNRTPLWFTRVLPPLRAEGGDSVVWTSPYWLDGPGVADAWLALGERVSRGAAEAERSTRLAAYFKAADEPRRWLEFITDAYAGVTDAGVVVLTGVQDMPQTLPHSRGNDPGAMSDPELSPFERVRLRLMDLANDADAPSGQSQLARVIGVAYSLYGALDARGLTTLERLAAQRGPLPEPEQHVLDTLLEGWFSVFEVLRVKLDEAIQLRDVLNERDLWIQEKAASRQVQLGDVIFGWLTVDATATRLEGAVGHVPAHLAKGFVSGMRRARRALEKERPELSWKKQLGLLALPACELAAEAFAHAPAPQLVNTEGHEVVLSEAHYTVMDRASVAARLKRAFEPGSESGTYHWGDDTTLWGVVMLKGKTLIAESNSRERLDDLKHTLVSLLGDLVIHRADAHQDPTTAIKAARKKGKTAVRAQALKIPPEVAQELHAMMLTRMRLWLDEPIPMLKGKTPRQAARSQRGRDDVTVLLTQQQELFNAGPGIPPIDLSEIWRELGLDPRV